MNIQNDVKQIISNVLDVSIQEITDDTAIGDMSSWDSLRHLIIISKIEEFFDIQFDPEVIMDLEDVSDIVAAVQQRKNV